MRLGPLRGLLRGAVALVLLYQPVASFSDGIIPPSTNLGSGSSSSGASVSEGRALFLKNCAHCHAADAHGDEGPDLHKLDLSDEWIVNRIRKGKAGEMTAFAGKLKDSEINALVKYVQSLK